MASRTLQRSEEDEVASFAMTLLSGSVPTMVLVAVADLGVLEVIEREGPAAGGFMSAAEIAAHLPTTNPEAATMLDRMLRLLVTYGVVRCDLRTTHREGRVERTYALAPVCLFFLTNEDWPDAGFMHEDRVLMETWYHLKDTVLDGGLPFHKAHGMNLFEYLGTDPRFNKVFNNSMSQASFIFTTQFLENYNGFQGISTLVDVGGGNGTTLSMIISKYPSIKGINFDLPHVVQTAPSYAGVEHIAGDMLVSIPKGDVIFMKWVCHDWSDEHCLKFLKNSYNALPSHGKVIICDLILPVVPEARTANKAMFQLDVTMLTTCPGGKERTKDEFEYLAKASGFSGVRIACSVFDQKVIEFFKVI